ncbi:MAG TPA: polysaccharide deacetylase family protein [Nitrospiraceae bacterium]|nr:polysaccharide deacetylase family protein [Nitrospiraceae bacterium]
MFAEFLRLSDAYGIPVTFAIVAHVAIADCASHREPPRFEPRWLGEDWFAVDPRSSLERDTNYYGLDLVQEILSSERRHEIASHGFSHVDLADDTTTPEVAAYEISESSRILRRLDDQLTTFVFPNNRPAFVNLVKDAGFTIYRNDVNGEIERDAAGLWKFPRGLWLSPLMCSPREMIELVGVAVRQRRLVNVWCHLHEFGSGDVLRGFLEPVFGCVERSRRKGFLRVDTMRGIVAVHSELTHGDA